MQYFTNFGILQKPYQRQSLPYQLCLPDYQAIVLLQAFQVSHIPNVLRGFGRIPQLLQAQPKCMIVGRWTTK